MASCTICFTIYSGKDEVTALACQHCYHKRCIEKWMSVRKECPQCRETINLNKMSKIYLNFMDVSNLEDSSNFMTTVPDISVYRTVKKQNLQIKKLEEIILKEQKTVKSLRQEVEELTKNCAKFEENIENMSQKNTFLNELVDEANAKSSSYHTDFIHFQSIYNNLVEQLLNKLVFIEAQIKKLDSYDFTETERSIYDEVNMTLGNVISMANMVIKREASSDTTELACDNDIYYDMSVSN